MLKYLGKTDIPLAALYVRCSIDCIYCLIVYIHPAFVSFLIARDDLKYPNHKNSEILQHFNNNSAY